MKYLGLYLLSGTLRATGAVIALTAIGFLVLPNLISIEMPEIGVPVFCLTAPFILLGGWVNAIWCFGLASYFDAIRQTAIDTRAIRYGLHRRERGSSVHDLSYP